MDIRLCLLLAASVFAAETSATVANARPAGSGASVSPSSSLRDELPPDARTKFDEARRLYRKSRFSEAREAFLAAYAKSGEPRVLYNVAVCDKALGRYAGAITTLRRSLAGGESTLPSSYRARVEESIRTLSRYVATVTIETTEGATVTVDGEPVRDLVVPLDTGTHTIAASRPGYEPASQEITVSAGTTERVVLTLVAIPQVGTAKIACIATERCEIRVGEESVGRAPLSITRSPGSYTVRAVVDGRTWDERVIEIAAGSVIDVALASRPPAMARLRVMTDHPDDAVIVDGQRIGTGSVERELPPGEHRVFIARPGGATKAIDILLRDNETRDLRVTLGEQRRSAGISPWWFVAGGVLAAGAATAAVVVATQPTRFEGNAAGTLNPFVVAASNPGVLR
jgi:hypothetical protein